jgi:arylsulfatase A-like enzyme
MPAPRNVLFIVIDQWRADALGCAGNPILKTPNLDRIAAEGALFSKHYTQAAPCGPARASLLTGMYQHNTGVVRNGTPLERTFANLALEARKAGYDPALFGYTDVAPDPTGLPPDDPALKTYEGVLDGFSTELLLTSEPTPWFAHLKSRGYGFRPDPLDVFAPSPGHEHKPRTFAPAKFKAEDSITAFLTNRLLDYIELRRDRPWFAHAAYISPHPPFIAPAPYHAMYEAAAMATPVRNASLNAEAAQHPLTAHYLQTIRQSSFFVGGEGLASAMSDAEIAQLRATYYGMIAEVDHQVGRIVDALQRFGLYDSTLIVVSADHAEMLGDHHQLGKQGYFPQAFHIPLLVRDPDAAADAARGARIERFTEAVDVMPTILEWLGRPIPRQVDGRSLLGFCRGTPPAEWRTEAHWEFDFRGAGPEDAETRLGLPMDACSLTVIRDDDWQYVHFAALPPLLFDLRRDPGCLVDLAQDAAHQGVVLRYAQKLLSWRATTNRRTFTGMTTSPGGLIERR